MAQIAEINLNMCPVKAIIKNGSIELWIKRLHKDWARVISIKASKSINKKHFPWSIRWYELGKQKYTKHSTWKDVNEQIGNTYFVELPEETNEQILPKIMMNKMY